jgi:hypothetical protein
MELTGKVIAVLPVRTGTAKSTGNEWKAQEYVIETVGEQYPRKMCFEVFGGDKIEQFHIQLGEDLTVSFDIDARQWQERWFNSIRAWKIERVAAGQPTVPPQTPPVSTPAPDFGTPNAADDLPF